MTIQAPQFDLACTYMVQGANNSVGTFSQSAFAYGSSLAGSKSVAGVDPTAIHNGPVNTTDLSK